MELIKREWEEYLELRNVEGISQSMKLAEFAADVEKSVLLITERWYRDEKIFHVDKGEKVKKVEKEACVV